ncbi:hypothetical protein COT94_01620 [Candidatus Falkowbacteria bacterium CG10_big_fil_rev_8_21_14_0_10_37_14]|uniref:Uncharacterized protein n=1 Tax=Candidatus Falkowbacteria bacterium CG10_big_fil_rev_8_21_14_0_10_37_14 TaxID=1974561 RepID=A0A2M6WTT1_9BACT|nr:hypothetical protein [Candidatus Falkowbacteria bacterium]PIT96203.1 MAG: hypothetical protein COT94_01620 [Candidatus Falkowbacteria bacterium CG10_big_fil_rev_8_21_14_0_10_37_14]
MKTGPTVRAGQIFIPEKSDMKILFQKSKKKNKTGKFVVLLDIVNRTVCCLTMNRPGAFCFINRVPEMDEVIEITAVHSNYLLGKIISYKKTKGG